MCLFSNFVEDLYEYLTGKRCCAGNIIRKHTKKLEEYGDVSFPLNIKNWKHLINTEECSNYGAEGECTILNFLNRDENLDQQLNKIIAESKSWHLQIESYKIVMNTDVHLYLNKSFSLNLCIKYALTENYGFQDKIFNNLLNIQAKEIEISYLPVLSLTELRMVTLRNIANNLINKLTQESASNENHEDIQITMRSQKNNENNIICGAVLNEYGHKIDLLTAENFWESRTEHMQLMAKHKYGIRLKIPYSYFLKLGKASLTIELLQNKPRKTIKMAFHDSRTAQKEPSFIFYNCARLAGLLKKFQSQRKAKEYPALPPVDEIDFGLLTQPEEWDLGYVCLLQFPLIIKSCVCDITKGIFNPQYLIQFISNLVSTFSVYYRRVKVLTIAKQHLFPVLFARIYLLKALQQVFHTCLFLLDIEPVKEM